jgi:hypothetical protein
MTLSHGRARPARRRNLAWVAAPLVLLGIVGASCSSDPNGAGSLGVSVTPVHGGSGAGTYRSGELIDVKVGPNKTFTPNLKVNILECSDPGGTKAHLPKSVADCDGNTIQGGTILINSNGSFSKNDYPVFALPNHALGEEATWQPVCNLTHQCVLYVGENQEDFTQPKLFSAPFTVEPTR